MQHAVINAKPVPIQLLACRAIRHGKGIHQQLNAHALLDIMIMVYLFARLVIIAVSPAQLGRNARHVRDSTIGFSILLQSYALALRATTTQELPNASLARIPV